VISLVCVLRCYEESEQYSACIQVPSSTRADDGDPRKLTGVPVYQSSKPGIDSAEGLRWFWSHLVARLKDFLVNEKIPTVRE